MNIRSKITWPLFAAALVIILDRFTKNLALRFITSPIIINRFFSFDLALNRGISWGLLHFTGAIGFFIVSVMVAAILCGIIIWAYRVYQRGGNVMGHALIIAGGFSNMFDRFLFGGVVDFISVSLNGWNWALFNIADVAIDVGVLLLLIQSLYEKQSD
jgi:lipoprotein signal peptidase